MKTHRPALLALAVFAVAVSAAFAAPPPDDLHPVPADEPTTIEKRTFVFDYLAKKTGRPAFPADLPKEHASSTCTYQYDAFKKEKKPPNLYPLIQGHLKTAEQRLQDNNVEVQEGGREIARTAAECAVERLEDRWLAVAIAEGFVLLPTADPDRDDKINYDRYLDSLREALVLFRAAKDHQRVIKACKLYLEKNLSDRVRLHFARALEANGQLEEALREFRTLERARTIPVADSIAALERKLADSTPPVRSAEPDAFWPNIRPTLTTAVTLLQKSEDRRKLEQACLTLARSDDAKALPRLGEFLTDPTFWPRLDDPEKIRHGGGVLRIGRVLEAVARKGGPAAEQIFLTLGANKDFMDDSSFCYPFIEALGQLPTPSDNIVKLLDSIRVKFNGEVTHALLRIGTPSALAMLEKRIRSDDFPARLRAAWCTCDLLPVRVDRNVVELYGRLLRSEIAEDSLRDMIVQSLFDYRPKEWDRGTAFHYPEPPPWTRASADVLRELLKLADVALELKIEPKTKEAVRKSRKEIEAALAAKEKK